MQEHEEEEHHMLQEFLSVHSSLAVPNQELQICSISSRHLYNLLSFKASDRVPAPLPIDLRSAPQFKEAHPRTAISVPIPPNLIPLAGEDSVTSNNNNNTNNQQSSAMIIKTTNDLKKHCWDDNSKSLLQWSSVYQVVIFSELLANNNNSKNNNNKETDNNNNSSGSDNNNSNNSSTDQENDSSKATSAQLLASNDTNYCHSFEHLMFVAQLFFEREESQEGLRSTSFSTFAMQYPFRCVGSAVPNKPYLYELFPSQILPFLFVGMALNAYSLEQLQHLRITHILNCAQECKNKFEGASIRHHPRPHHHHHQPQHTTPTAVTLKYLSLSWEDAPDMQFNQVKEMVSFVEEARLAGGRVLVHCMEGKSRSASAAILYLMHYKGWPFQKAFDYVKFHRPIIEPNSGFLRQMEEFVTATTTENVPLDRDNNNTNNN